MPASEALLDEDSIKRFRSRYREKFGATATQDPLYQALSDGRRMAGMEHWLPLLEERLATLFDHLGDDDLIVRDAGADQALEARREAIDDYYKNRVRAMEAEPGSYRPLEPQRALSRSRRMGRADRERADPPRLAVSRARIATTIIDFGVEAARDFAPERAQQANVYEAVAGACREAAQERPQGRARELHARRARAAAGLLEDHGLKTHKLADSWQEALGAQDASRRCSSCRSTTASPRPRSRCSPSRTCSATGWSAAASGARPPTPSSPSSRRSRRATSSSTPITASAATRG